MFSHYSITILPFEGQGEHQIQTSSPIPEKKTVAITSPKNPVHIGSPSKKKQVKVEALNTSYKSGNIGILDTLSPKSKKRGTGEEIVNIQAKDTFTEEELTRQIKLYAHKKKKEEGASNLFSTLTACKLTIHDQFNLKLHVLNTTQSKQLDIIKMDLLNFLRKELNNGEITFEHVLKESATVVTASFTDKKSQFDELAVTNPSLEKFRKLFNLDIEY